MNFYFYCSDSGDAQQVCLPIGNPVCEKVGKGNPVRERTGKGNTCARIPYPERWSLELIKIGFSTFCCF
jgi:hypothetical protein